jgi:hypothetical protein
MKRQLPFTMFYNIKWLLRYGVPMVWITSGLLSTGWVAIAIEDFLIDDSLLIYCAVFNAFVLLFCYVTSFFVPKVIRRVTVACLITCFPLSGIVFLFSLAVVFYFVAKHHYLDELLFVGLVVAVWLLQVYVNAIKRVKKKKLIEKYYKEFDECFVLQKTIREFDGDVRFTRDEHIRYNWIYGFWILFSVYEFFVTDFGEYLPMDLFKYWLMSSLSGVLLFYFLGRYVQGFYLWIYLPWRLEIKTGKRFLFPDPKDGSVLEMI